MNRLALAGGRAVKWLRHSRISARQKNEKATENMNHENCAMVP